MLQQNCASSFTLTFFHLFLSRFLLGFFYILHFLLKGYLRSYTAPLFLLHIALRQVKLRPKRINYFYTFLWIYVSPYSHQLLRLVDFFHLCAGKMLRRKDIVSLCLHILASEVLSPCWCSCYCLITFFPTPQLSSLIKKLSILMYFGAWAASFEEFRLCFRFESSFKYILFP